ncbi:MAG: hypothetical protein ACK55Z_08665, partial [bacterium]
MKTQFMIPVECQRVVEKDLLLLCMPNVCMMCSYCVGEKGFLNPRSEKQRSPMDPGPGKGPR